MLAGNEPSMKDEWAVFSQKSYHHATFCQHKGLPVSAVPATHGDNLKKARNKA